eukprot:641158-Pleurochrysis_carterae.AAC.2
MTLTHLANAGSFETCSSKDNLCCSTSTASTAMCVLTRGLCRRNRRLELSLPVPAALLDVPRTAQLVGRVSCPLHLDQCQHARRRQHRQGKEKVPRFLGTSTNNCEKIVARSPRSHGREGLP